MIRTMEIRWFNRESPLELSHFFDESMKPQTRIDWYAYPGDPRSGIKVREGKFEMKLRVGKEDVTEANCYEGVMEEWCKWSLEFLEDDVPPPEFLSGAGWFPVEKRRYLKVLGVKGKDAFEFDDWMSNFPERGVEFELTEVFLNNSNKWWTLGFEAFGPRESLAEDLIIVSTSVLHGCNTVNLLKAEESFSYPFFINSLSLSD